MTIVNLTYRVIMTRAILAALLLSPGVLAQSFWDLLNQSAQNNNRSERMSSETVMIINTDGRTYTMFDGTRSDGNLNIFVKPGSKPTDYAYFFPHNVRVEKYNSQHDLFKVPPGGYSSMSAGTFSTSSTDGKKPALIVNTDGSLTYNSWDGKTYSNNGENYGQWATPHNFRYFSVAWVVPENIEILKYSSNRAKRGRWRYEPPVLSFIGSTLNNFTYTVTYRVRQSVLEDAKTLP